MNVKDFRNKIKPGSRVKIGDLILKTDQVIKFRFDDGTCYFKCILSNGYVLADDENGDFYVLVKNIENRISQPFPNELIFKNEKFKFIYRAHAIAEEVFGEEHFKKGYGEGFWDYQGENGGYLSLGITDNANKRLDFFGKIVKNNKLEVLDD